jgi:serine/threonine-protein kinase
VAYQTTAQGERQSLPTLRIPAGTRLSVYRIEQILGEGGMGVVYLAHDEALDRPVAVKCLHSNLAGDESIRRRFAREARVLQSWSHPNVVGVFDFLEQQHLLAIVMEYVPGPTLVEHLGRWRGRMPFAEIGLLFGGVLEAMAEAHRQGVVHRDLKPDNILVCQTGAGLRPKIVDFGLARVLEATSYTMSGAFLGTCRYMSPEQVKSPQRADSRSDIYSLGVTLYQLTTGRVPFDGGNHFSIMMAHVSETPQPASKHRPDVPPGLELLLQDALAKDPADRPATCEEFLRRLESALGTTRSLPPDSPARSLPPVLRAPSGDEMVLVTAGPFLMGPARREIFLDAFYIDRTPVTNEQFRQFLEVTGYQPSDEGSHRFLAHWRRGQLPPGLERHPIVHVSWQDARAYAQWAGKRLPTEAEWEKAARGTDGRLYPWGRDKPTPQRANYGSRHGGTVPVGSYPDGMSPCGALDMAGNVWEWCDDIDDPTFYAEGPSQNPRNPGDDLGPRHVMRGGSWMYGEGSLRVTARTSFEPSDRFAGGGFRCVRPA